MTTELVGNCGHGCAPITEPDLFLPNIYGYSPRRPLTWRTMAGYLDALEQARPAINVCSLVANGNLRLATLGLEDRPATPAELGRMEVLLQAALDEGAWGHSTGLEYAAERACTEAEMVVWPVWRLGVARCGPRIRATVRLWRWSPSKKRFVLRGSRASDCRFRTSCRDGEARRMHWRAQSRWSIVLWQRVWMSPSTRTRGCSASPI